MTARVGLLRARTGGRFLLAGHHQPLFCSGGTSAARTAVVRGRAAATASSPQALLSRLSSRSSDSRGVAHGQGRGNAEESIAAPRESPVRAAAVGARGEGLYGKRWLSSQAAVSEQQQEEVSVA